jgi:hypothetical protein
LIRRRFAVFDRVFFAASSSLACESSYLVGALRSRGGGRNGRVKLGINKDLQVPRPDSAFSAADVIIRSHHCLFSVFSPSFLRLQIISLLSILNTGLEKSSATPRNESSQAWG